jgi:probable rRNA maturation factor
MAARLSLTVQYACNTPDLPTRAQFRRWIKKALRCDASLTLRLVDVPEGRSLNNQYRSKNYATNVLTFVYDDDPLYPDIAQEKPATKSTHPDPSGSTVRGDVVICAPVVEDEAKQQRKTPVAHYAHLCVHAALHLQGYEHDEEEEALEMESMESALMLELGFQDPYEAGQT